MTNEDVVEGMDMDNVTDDTSAMKILIRLQNEVHQNKASKEQVMKGLDVAIDMLEEVGSVLSNLEHYEDHQKEARMNDVRKWIGHFG
jgi:hypothetical protein